MFEVVKEQYDVQGAKLIELLKKKRDAYGDNLTSGATFLHLFYPDGIPVAAYKDLLIMVRVLDKLFRLANQHRHDDSGDGFFDDESPWWDVAGYGLATVVDRVLEGRERRTDEG